MRTEKKQEVFELWDGAYIVVKLHCVMGFLYGWGKLKHKRIKAFLEAGRI